MNTAHRAREPDGQLQDVPDFRWPYKIAGHASEWLSNRWEDVKDKALTHLEGHAVLRWTLVVIITAVLAYLLVLWGCFCYLKFPVSPFGVWDLMEWLIKAGSVVWGAIALYFFAAFLFVLLWIMLLIATYFTLSLGYLCWSVWNAHRTPAPWLKRYSPVMIFGMVAALGLATFADGAYRFWDMPFTAFHWAKFAFVSVSAWAALFCHLMDGNVRFRGTPRKIFVWTFALTVLVGLLALGHANQDREEYFLRKDVALHPNDSAAWVELARHYEYQGDVVANDPGDENHGPGDPKPWYEDALESINRAIELGAGGFKVRSSRAKLADEVGQKKAAIAFAQEALQSASSGATADSNPDVKWLQEMMARNTSALPELQEDEKSEQERQRIRDRRRRRLPWILRWVFDPPESQVEDVQS
jgi:hypothetical protein